MFHRIVSWISGTSLKLFLNINYKNDKSWRKVHLKYLRGSTSLPRSSSGFCNLPNHLQARKGNSQLVNYLLLTFYLSGMNIPTKLAILLSFKLTRSNNISTALWSFKSLISLPLSFIWAWSFPCITYDSVTNCTWNYSTDFLSSRH